MIAASADVHPQAVSTTRNTESDFTMIMVYTDVQTPRAAPNTVDTGSDLDIITVSDEAHLNSAPNTMDTKSDFDIITVSDEAHLNPALNTQYTEADFNMVKVSADVHVHSDSNVQDTETARDTEDNFNVNTAHAAKVAVSHTEAPSPNTTQRKTKLCMLQSWKANWREYEAVGSYVVRVWCKICQTHHSACMAQGTLSWLVGVACSAGFSDIYHVVVGSCACHLRFQLPALASFGKTTSTMWILVAKLCLPVQQPLLKQDSCHNLTN